MSSAVASIACRFGTEVIEIQGYIGFVRSKSALHVQEVDDLNVLLRKEQLPDLPVCEHLGTTHYLSADEIQDLIPVIDRVKPRIDKVVSTLNPKIDALSKFDNDGIASQHPGLLSEWIAYLLPKLPVSPSADQLAILREQTIQQSDRELDETEEEVSRDERILLIDEALKRARYFKTNARLETLHYMLDRFGELRIIAKAGQRDAVTGPLRQGFIVLIAAFDAAIFDLVRVALQRQFFKLARALAKQDKLSIPEIADHGSFEARPYYRNVPLQAACEEPCLPSRRFLERRMLR